MSLLICSFFLFFCRVHPSFFLKLKSVTTDPWRSRSSIRIFCPQRYSWVISVFKWISNGFFYRLSSLHHYVLGPIILKSLISTHGGQEVKKNLSELSILIVTCHECSSYCLCDSCRPLEQLCRSSWQSPIFLSRTWSPCAHHMCQNFVAFFSLIHWFDFKPLHRPHLYKAGNKSASLLFATASQPTCLLCSCTFSSRWTCIQTCNKMLPLPLALFQLHSKRLRLQLCQSEPDQGSIDQFCFFNSYMVIKMRVGSVTQISFAHYTQFIVYLRDATLHY